MASIRKRNGKYQITVSLGRDSKDRQIRKMTTYKPKAITPKAIEKEVRRYADEFEERVRNGQLYSGEKMTVNDFVEIWIECCLNRKNIADSTRHERISYLEREIIPHIEHLKLTNVKATHIDKILNDQVDKGYIDKPRKIYIVLNSIFGYAYKKEFIKDNPMLRVDYQSPRNNSVKNEIECFNADQATRFLEFIDNEIITNPMIRKKYGVQSIPKIVVLMYKSLFALALFGGFRRGELCALTWNDINFKNNTISISKALANTYTEKGIIVKEPKTVYANRTVKLPQICFDFLAKWREEEIKLMMELGSEWIGYRENEFDGNFVFIDKRNGNHISLYTPSKKFKDIVKLYNSVIDDENLKLPNICFHKLCHTSATLLIANNVDPKTVSHRMGHSKASITLDVYTHPLESMDEVASDVLEKALPVDKEK